MKIKLVAVALLLILTSKGLSAQEYEPKILILSPNEFTYDKSFENEINARNKDLAKKWSKEESEEAKKSQEEIDDLGENVKMMLNSMEKYSDVNFFRSASISSFLNLMYEFMEFSYSSKNMLILLSEKKSTGNLIELRQIAEDESMRFLLNFSKIQLLHKNGITYATISVQLYDHKFQNFLIDKEYEGDWTFQSFKLPCEEKTIDCALNGALFTALSDVVNMVVSNSENLSKNIKIIDQNQNNVTENYYQPTVEDFLKSVIVQPEIDINVNDQYQIIFDKSNTKFIAFFIRKIDAEEYQSLNKNNSGGFVIHISDEELNTNIFSQNKNIPKTYAYLITGVKYQDHWYYDKGNTTFFDNDNVEQCKLSYFNIMNNLYHFLKKKSSEIDTKFWEGILFSKVESVYVTNKAEINQIKSNLQSAKSENDKKYYYDRLNYYNNLEIENKDYIGLYTIVANHIKRENKQGKQH